MNYNYKLDPGSKKFHCPRCRQKRFVQYIDPSSGQYLAKEFGRCDRESKCSYHKIPYGDYEKNSEIKYIPPPPPSYHPLELVSQYGRNFRENNFVQFLKTELGEEKAKQAIEKYLLGTIDIWKGSTVFWQIDKKGNVRHGKVMLYDRHTGKRKKRKNGGAFISSIRSVLRLKQYNLVQCLFGLHLLNPNDLKPIGLVESEKTAIIMSLFKSEYMWMATGSKNGFKYEMLKALRGCEITAFPDSSEYLDWEGKAIELRALGLDIQVSKLLEDQNYLQGTDLADVYLGASRNENSFHGHRRGCNLKSV